MCLEYHILFVSGNNHLTTHANRKKRGDEKISRTKELVLFSAL